MLFPDRGQASATTIAGVLAVLAPAIGPYIGGWITSTYDWPWLFLINTGPGVVAATIAATLLPRERPDLGLLRDLDLPALALMAIALACLEIGLKEAPARRLGRISRYGLVCRQPGGRHLVRRQIAHLGAAGG